MCHPEHIRFAQCKLREGSLFAPLSTKEILRPPAGGLRMTPLSI